MSQYLKHMTNEEVTERYVKMRFYPIKQNAKGYFIVKCPFQNHENDGRSPAFNIYKDGRFKCFKCQRTGNLITLARHFGEDLRKIFN